VPSPADLDRARREALAAVGRALGVEVWPEVPVAWNRRLRRAGQAVVEGSGRRFRRAAIELSPAYFEVYPEDLRGIVVHEMVHVGLALLGLPLGHGPAFRRACRAAGGLLHGRSLPGRVFRYRCPVCGATVERRRRVARDRWCAACVARATREGGDPFTPDRVLVLVATGYVGPEA